jgi:hypothetical protein
MTSLPTAGESGNSSVGALIESRIEPTEPQDGILAALKEHDGKPFTVRTVAKLQEATGDQSIRLSKSYTMTHLEWGRYGATQGREGGSLFVAHTTKNVRVDTVHIEEQNACYYSALKERNWKRRKLLEQPKKLAELDKAIAEYKQASGKLQSLLEGAFDVDRYAIDDALVKGQE